jgi:microcystin-dependent protein
VKDCIKKGGFMDPFLGEIKAVGFNYAPEGYAFCARQSMQIQQASALFALLGIAFGGDGQKNFNLPDLRSRVPVGFNMNTSLPAGLTSYPMGNYTGTETTAVAINPVSLTINNIPSHLHSATFTPSSSSSVTPTGKVAIKCSVNAANTPNPDGAVPAVGNGSSGGESLESLNLYNTDATPSKALADLASNK